MHYKKEEEKKTTLLAYTTRVLVQLKKCYTDLGEVMRGELKQGKEGTSEVEMQCEVEKAEAMAVWINTWIYNQNVECIK